MIAIADLDLISEQFFELRRRKIENLELDNVTFVLNCVDVLAGDESFVALRKHGSSTAPSSGWRRRPRSSSRSARSRPRRPRTRRRSSSTSPENLDKQVDAVRARKDIDERTKEIMLMNIQEVANRRLEVKKANIEDQKRKKIQESKGEMEQKIRGIQNQVRAWPIVLHHCRHRPRPDRLLRPPEAREPRGQPEPARLTTVAPHRLTQFRLGAARR